MTGAIPRATQEAQRVQGADPRPGRAPAGDLHGRIRRVLALGINSSEINDLTWRTLLSAPAVRSYHGGVGRKRIEPCRYVVLRLSLKARFAALARARQARSPLRRFLRGERGAIAIYFGLSAIVFIGVAGLAVDAARGYLVKARLSEAIDAAALAGGKAVQASGTGTTPRRRPMRWPSSTRTSPMAPWAPR